MPRIPRMTDSRRVQQRGLPDGSINPATPAGTFGPDLGPAADQLSQIALRAADRANTARVMEADSTLTDFENQILYDPQNGALNLRGRNAFGLPEQVMTEYDRRVAEIEQDLNPRQREAFTRLARQRRDSIGRTVQRHVSSEISAYEQQQADSLISGSQLTAANHYNDPERIGMELRRQRGAILARSQDMGWSPERTRLEIRRAESATHGAVIGRLAANDPQAAIRYFARHGPEMTPEDQTAYETVVRETRQRDAADRIVAGITGTGMLNADGVWGRMIPQESGGNQFAADGSPLISPAGAVGVSQMLVSTGPEAARLAGLEWDEERLYYDKGYNLTLGRAYFDAQVEQYGDPMLAAAAYNAGPGRVDEWLREIGDPREGEISRAEFAQRIPFDETRNYVMTVAPPGQTTPAQEPLSRSQQMALLNRLPAEVRDLASDRLEAIWAQEDQQQQELYEAVQLEVENGTAYADLPPRAVERLTADQIQALRARSRELATGEPTMDWRRWTELSSMSREELAAIDDPYTALRPYLDDSHYNKALDLINDAKGIGEDINTSNTLTFNQRVNNTAQQAGIIPADETPSQYSEEESLRLARFQTEAAARIEAEERQRGRRLTGGEQQEVLDDMLTERIMIPGSGFGPDFLYGDTEAITWSLDEDEMGDAYVPIAEIPEDHREVLANRLRGNGHVASDDLIQKAYAQLILGNGEAYQNILTRGR